MSKFKALQPVRVERPGKEGHLQVGRFLEESPADGLAWVAFNRPAKDRGKAPAEGDCRKSAKVEHKLLPLSNLRTV